MSAAEARRESAREVTGRFGVQEHTAPEAVLAELPDFRGDRARQLDDQLTELRKQRDALMEERRDEHLLDIARKLPADVSRIVFRAEYNRDGEREMILFDHAEDDTDLVGLDTALTDHLYSVAFDFGTPGDYVADEWLDNEGDGYYWVDLDEETALGHAHDFRSEINGFRGPLDALPLGAYRGNIAWTERAMRVRAHSVGIASINFAPTRDNDGVEVVSFRLADGTIVAPDDANDDHMFLAAQAQHLPARSEAMTATGDAAGTFTLEV